MSSWGSSQLRDSGIKDVALAFDTWRTPNANRPSLVMANVRIQPSGISVAEITLDIDRSGGTNVDDSKLLRGPAGLGGPLSTEMTAWVPAGGSYRVANVIDPNSNNAILEINEVAL